MGTVDNLPFWADYPSRTSFLFIKVSHFRHFGGKRGFPFGKPLLVISYFFLQCLNSFSHSPRCSLSVPFIMASA